MPNYNINLDTPSELVTIVEDMIDDREEFVREQYEAQLEALRDDREELVREKYEAQLEALRDENESLSDIIDDLKERISDLESEKYE